MNGAVPGDTLALMLMGYQYFFYDLQHVIQIQISLKRVDYWGQENWKQEEEELFQLKVFYDQMVEV